MSRRAGLELAIPPDVVAVAVGLLMWLVSRVTPTLAYPRWYGRAAALVCLIVGIVLIVAARVRFAKVGTTFSPIAPEHTRQLVTSGVYRLTRNPMYLGTMFVLLALAALWASPIAALVSLAFAAYIDRFQIQPEERVLRERFGASYELYARRVRRWL